jgi:CheY-like chemotaxis protein
MNALIVDDEPLARLRLRTMLADHGDVTVIGECADAIEAAQAIERGRPDVVFLDVQMPQVDGFALLQSLASSPPRVIFTTAHAAHAVQAFDVNAVDFLLKPFDDARLAVTMERTRSRLAARGATASWTAPSVSCYEIEQPVGSGAVGQVYKARDRRLGRTVALKFLAPGLSGEPELERRLLQEAQAAAALDHPNVCALLGVERTEDGRPYLVMPFYDGETLKGTIARGPLPIDTARRYARQIAAGLAHAHAAGVIHRDIKPARGAQDPRLRRREARHGRTDQCRGPARHARVHEPGAGSRRAGGRRGRSLGPGCGAVRDAVGATAVRRPQR